MSYTYNTSNPDYLNVQTNKEIVKIISNEVVLFSYKISQLSSYNMATSRALVITSKAIYMFKQNGPKKRKLKLAIDFAQLEKVTRSLLSTQFILHTLSDQNYRFRSEKVDEIVEMVKIAYVSALHKNLSIYGIKAKDLKEYKKLKDEAKLLEDQNLIKDEEIKFDFKLDDEDEGIKSQETASDDNQDEPRVIEVTSSFQAQDYEKQRSSTLYSRESEDDTVMEDFEIKQVLGIGSFGKVYLVENNKTGKLHAMKSIYKDKIHDFDKMESTKLEEHILLNSEHPHIVSLDYVFEDTKKIYFIMKFIQGGELFKQIIDCRRFEEDRAKFYAIQIALALGHLHSQDVVYRDLKPENILIGEDGYVYLTDFGLSRILARDEFANSF